MPGTIRLVDADGTIRDVPEEMAGLAVQQGMRPVTEQEELQRLGTQAREADYGGVGGAIGAGVAGAARGATLGLSDVALRALGGDQVGLDLAALREVNPGTSFAGELVGALSPVGPAAWANAAGHGVAALSEGAGLAARVGAGAAGGALTGSLYGAGAGLTEASLADDPLTIERVASSVSSNALYGGALGGAVGAAMPVLEAGASKLKGAIDNRIARAAKARTPEEAIDSGDLELLDAKTLRGARDAELEAISKARQPQRDGFVEDLAAVRQESFEKQIWNATRGAPDRESRSIGRDYLEADKAIDRLLKDRVSLAEHPERALGPLRRQQQALEALEDMRLSASKAFDDEIATARPTLRDQIKAGLVKDERGPFTEQGLDYATEREIGRRYGSLDNPTRPTRLQYLDKVPEELKINRDLQHMLGALTEHPTSDRLQRIDDALEALGTPKPPSLGQAVLSVAAPFAGPVGAAAAVGGKIVGGLSKLAEAAATRTGKAVSGFLGGTTKAIAAATPHAPLLATQVLASLRFGETGETASPRPPRSPSSAPTSSLPALYQARTHEVKSQVQIAPDGSFQMRPDARAKMARKFDSLRAVDPRAADRLETIGARRIEYLASIIPRLPDFGTVKLGPDRRQVPELAMRSWARAAAAVEDPHAAIERMQHGAFTPEDAMALRAVYPELVADLTNRITQQLPTLREKLPYRRRLALSILTGVPVDPAMTPGVLRVLQGMFAAEPGTAGGTQAPTPQPAFGSVKRSDPGTPAQRRAGLI